MFTGSLYHPIKVATMIFAICYNETSWLNGIYSLVPGYLLRVLNDLNPLDFVKSKFHLLFMFMFMFIFIFLGKQSVIY